MPRRTKEEAAQTRRRILEAALDVFSEKGYSRTRFVDIAERIGLTKGAIYWHFRTKSDLLAAMIDHEVHKHYAGFMEKRPSTITEFRGIWLHYAQMAMEKEDIQKFEFFYNCQIEWSAELMTDVHKKLEALRGDPMKDLNEVLIRLQELGELSGEAKVQGLSLSLVAMWIGAIQLTLMGECSFEEFYELIEHGFDTFVGQHAVRSRT